MKQIKLLFLTLLVLGVVSAQNLIPNGDMSTWEEDSPIPYGYENRADQDNSDKFAKSEELYDGSLNAVWLKWRNSSNTSTRTLVTPLTSETLEPGLYKLSFYLKGSGWLRNVSMIHENIPNVADWGTANVRGDSILQSFPFNKTPSTPEYFESWTKIEEEFTITKSGKYRISFNHNILEDNRDPFLLANISLIKYLPPVSLSNITLSEPAYTGEAANGTESIPLFDSDILNYTVELSFNYEGGIPLVDGVPRIPEFDVDITQAVDLDGNEAERTATIVVSDSNDQETTYTVTFVKTYDFINGFHYNFKALDNLGGWGYLLTTGIYAKNENPDGIYWGTGIIRGNTDKAFSLYTPELTNGAHTISYYLKNTGLGDSGSSDLLVQYRKNPESSWELLETVPSSVLTDKFVQRTIPVNNVSTTGQVRFHIELESPRHFALDDVRVTAHHDIISGISEQVVPLLDVKVSNRSLLVKTPNSEDLLQLYSLDGRLLQSTKISSVFSIMQVEHAGIYVLKYGDMTKKILIQ